MKYAVTTVIACLFVLPLVAQDEPTPDSFEAFRKGLLDEFDDFRKNLNREYAQFLAGAWEEFQLFKGESLYRLPKPLTPNKAPEKNIAASTTGQPVGNIEPVVTIHVDEPDVRNELEADLVQQAASFPVQYYGHNIRFNYALQNTVRLKSTDNKAIGRLWETFSGSAFSGLLLGTLDNREAMQMNDWAYILLVRQIARQLPALTDANSRVVFEHFLLVQAGFDARLGKMGRELVLLLPIYEQVFNYPFLKIEGERFYVVSDKDFSQKSNMLSFALPEKLKKGRKVSLAIAKPLLLPMKGKTFSLEASGITVKGMVNENKVRFLNDYAPCHLGIYACAVPDAGLHTLLMDTFRKAITGKTETEAIALILSWVQHAFAYKTDQGQFGKEKTFFIEDNFYYHFNDCEDRAIFFAYLVRHLLGNKVVLLSYSDHVATAICYTSAQEGDYVTIGNRKYIICDPTYIPAAPGQAMPRYKKEQATVISIN